MDTPQKLFLYKIYKNRDIIVNFIQTYNTSFDTKYNFMIHTSEICKEIFVLLLLLLKDTPLLFLSELLGDVVTLVLISKSSANKFLLELEACPATKTKKFYYFLRFFLFFSIK